MKVTKVLVIYLLFGCYLLQASIIGECSFFGKIGIALVIIGSLLIMGSIGEGFSWETKGRYAVSFSIFAVGILLCIIDAIRRLICNIKTIKKEYEEVSFFEFDWNDEFKNLKK